jgi:hypothetical protein
VPGQPDVSELILRITTSDADLVMPPPDSHKTLDAAEKDILRRWIADGAEYKDHWSFLLPERKAPSNSTDAAWNENTIDRFVLAALHKRGMTPSPDRTVQGGHFRSCV